MNTNTELAIIILNWNGLKDTVECLDSIQKHMIKGSYKVFLIDNASTEDIQPLYDFETRLNISIIKLKNNIGFAAGNNVGMKRALIEGFEYFLLLNNDTVLIDDSINCLVREMSNTSNIGIGGIINYYYSNPNKIWQSGLNNNFKTGVNKVVKYDINEKKKVFVMADYVPGSSFMIKKKVIDRIGLLDYQYFAYFEENDYCVIAKKNGFDVGFLTGSKILHKVGNSSPNSTKIYLRTRNRLLFYSKFTIQPFRIFIFIMSSINQLKEIAANSNKRKNIRALYYGWIDHKKSVYYKGSISKI